MDEELKAFIEQTAIETRRHFDVVAGRLESKMEVIADGVVAANRRIQSAEAEMREEFAEVKSMIKFSHQDLDKRLRSLEETVSDLQSRVERLEAATS
ncbi:MAG TPA: hypothetical protein VF608_02140 [Thermoanaerobaculia bacterium]